VPHVLAAAAGQGLTSVPGAGAVERSVVAGGLPATFLTPDRGAARAAVLLIAGSGPTDRDGNNAFGVSASYLAKLARALGDAGIASLRYDKRGVPGSIAVEDEGAITFDTIVDDAARAIDWLQAATPGTPLAAIGHSEGGLVALELAARRERLNRLVLLATPGRRPAETLRDQLGRLEEPLRAKALAILAELEAGGTDADVPPPLLPLFRPSVQPFVRSLFSLDPAARLRMLGRPTLAVGGGRDIQVGRADFDALVAVAGVRALWLETMNHALAPVDTDDIGDNLAAYADPLAPLAPGLAEAVAGFLLRDAR
jgi:pimeloyl-ACP methyl ester carboxylesterase